MMEIAQRTVVIGGGITGLACAYYLKQAGIPVTLLEASNRPGGMVASIQRNGFLFETGPQIPRFTPRLMELVRETGLASEFLEGDRDAPRYVLKEGRLERFPLSPLSYLASGAIGLGSKMKLTAEAFRHSRPPEEEETLAHLIRRKIGRDFLEYLVDPVVSAVFAGDTEKMGVESAFPFLVEWEREYGSLLRGAFQSWKRRRRKKGEAAKLAETQTHYDEELAVTKALPPLGTLRRGLGTLAQGLAMKLGSSLRLGARAERIDSPLGGEDADSRWRIRLQSGEELNTAAVVLATPAYEVASLLGQASPQLSATLDEIEYAPMVVVGSGYERRQVRHPLRGFGLMIPRCEGLNTLYNVWNSSMFPGRAPEGMTLVTSFAGGATNPAFCRHTDEVISQIIEKEIGEVLRIQGAPFERFVWNFSDALPQLNIGHARRAAAIREAAALLPGLYLAGNYLEGRSLGDCVEVAYRTAGSVTHRFRHLGIESASTY
jgi:protoporphyrinogen/coproporphyrinogen III oxidase